MLLRPADYDRSLRFYRDELGLAIARDYGAGTVFYAGQSLIELAGHGEPNAAGTMWLQVRDVYATEKELTGRGVRDRARGTAGAVGSARDARDRSRRRHPDLRPGARDPSPAPRHQKLKRPPARSRGPHRRWIQLSRPPAASRRRPTARRPDGSPRDWALSRSPNAPRCESVVLSPCLTPSTLSTDWAALMTSSSVRLRLSKASSAK